MAMTRTVGRLAGSSLASAAAAILAAFVVPLGARKLPGPPLGQASQMKNITGSSASPNWIEAAGLLSQRGAVAHPAVGASRPRTTGTIIGTLPAPWDTRIGRFTVNLAAQQTIAQHPPAGYFSAGPSLLIVAAYAAAAIAAADFVITRRDA